MAEGKKIVLVVGFILVAVLSIYDSGHPHGAGVATRLPADPRYVVNTMNAIHPGTVRTFCRSYRDVGYNDARIWDVFRSGATQSGWWAAHRRQMRRDGWVVPSVRGVFDELKSRCF